jgi:multidrug transporter EmrE-like cation transporter
MGIYAFTGFLFRESLKYKSFGVVGLLWHIVMTILTLLISIFIFNDTYNLRDIIGLVLGFGSMILLLSNGHNH